MDFSKLDIFPKLDNEYRVGTKAGGLFSICSILAIIFFSIFEINAYRNPPIRERLYVDTSRPVGIDGKTISMEAMPQLDISLNITFPHIPCYLMHFDAIDQFTQMSLPISDAKKQIFRMKNNKTLSEYDFQRLITQNITNNTDYCGPCYVDALERCCNSCQSVVDTLEEFSISNMTLNDIEQCNNFVDDFTHMEGEGCRFEVNFHVPKTDSEFHICPGIQTVNSNGQHSHNIRIFGKQYEDLNMSHEITSLHFSKETKTSILDNYSEIQEKEGSYGIIYMVDILQNSYSVSKFAKYSPMQFPSGLTVVYGISPIHATKYVDREPFAHLISRFVTVIGGVLCIFKILDYLFFMTRKKKLEEIPQPK